MRTAMTGGGKSQATAWDIVHTPDAAHIVIDPAMKSLAETVLLHAPTNNVIFDRLSDLEHAPGYPTLEPSTHPDSAVRHSENDRRSESFIEMMLRKRQSESLAGAPLMEDWLFAVLRLFLYQSIKRHIRTLPFAFMPGTKEFDSLLHHCTIPEIRHKFQQLEKLTPRALRAEVGSVSRLIHSVFRSHHFLRRAVPTFDLGKFLQGGGWLIVERGGDMSDDAMRVIIGVIIKLVMEHARRRPRPYPVIVIHIDEVTTERLVGPQEVRGVATTRKDGLFWDFLDQNLDVHGHADALLQNCHRHEWMCCARHDLARKAATDIAAGLTLSSDESRAEQIDSLTRDIMNLKPGWRWVRDQFGSRKEYVPLLQHPFPDWPGLREARLKEKLECIYRRAEYQKPEEPASETGSQLDSQPRRKSRDSSSPAGRLKQIARKRADGSEKNESGNESE